MCWKTHFGSDNHRGIVPSTCRDAGLSRSKQLLGLQTSITCASVNVRRYVDCEPSPLRRLDYDQPDIFQLRWFAQSTTLVLPATAEVEEAPPPNSSQAMYQEFVQKLEQERGEKLAGPDAERVAQLNNPAYAPALKQLVTESRGGGVFFETFVDAPTTGVMVSPHFLY